MEGVRFWVLTNSYIETKPALKICCVKMAKNKEHEGYKD